MYSEGIIDKIRALVRSNNRIFFSYAEVPEDINPKLIVAMLNKSVPLRYVSEQIIGNTDIKIDVQGIANCSLRR